MHLTNWTAKRAGAHMTVYGDAAIGGSRTKLVGVTEIKPVGGKVIATDKMGVEHTLRT